MTLGEKTTQLFSEFFDTTIVITPEGEVKDWRIRLADIIIGSSLIALTSPLWLPATLAVGSEALVRNDATGILYRQERVGLRGNFILYKFRTMVDTTIEEEMIVRLEQGSIEGYQAIDDKYDWRITKLGRVLRATRIDELPNLINVVLGHMSMVGPRPRQDYEIWYVYDWAKNVDKENPYYDVACKVLEMYTESHTLQDQGWLGPRQFTPRHRKQTREIDIEQEYEIVPRYTGDRPFRYYLKNVLNLGAGVVRLMYYRVTGNREVINNAG
jgi:lipopolysaccharide/colanic/teichoic acid biosynthesis glycosyltransferase